LSWVLICSTYAVVKLIINNWCSKFNIIIMERPKCLQFILFIICISIKFSATVRCLDLGIVIWRNRFCRNASLFFYLTWIKCYIQPQISYLGNLSNWNRVSNWSILLIDNFFISFFAKFIDSTRIYKCFIWSINNITIFLYWFLTYLWSIFTCG